MTTQPPTPIPAPRARRRFERSPSYPGISLDRAIERAQVLYDQEGRNSSPIDAILHHWGYKPKTGPGLVTLAALKKFGLLVDSGSGASRAARLSEEALTILLRDTGDPHRAAAIRRAALRPAIHAELWEEFESGLPSDTSLKLRLIRERNFTATGADEFIAQFKRTIEFAKLSESDSLSVDDPQVEPEPKAPVPRPSGGKLVPYGEGPGLFEAKAFNLPLLAGTAVLQIPSLLTEDDWDLLMAVLKAMKPGLIRRDERAVGEQVGNDREN